MSRVVIDASVAVKWVVEEEGTADALELLHRFPLSSPDLLIPECANILWKKVRRAELKEEEAILAARLLQRSDVEILPTRTLMESALNLSIVIDHAAYDCIYVSLALENDWRFVTADERLVRKLSHSSGRRFDDKIVLLSSAGNLA